MIAQSIIGLEKKNTDMVIYHLDKCQTNKMMMIHWKVNNLLEEISLTGYETSTVVSMLISLLIDAVANHVISKP